MNELALFSGVGGGILGSKLMGWRTLCGVEINAYAASVLVARQNERHLEPFPIFHDVRTFNGRPWRGLIDVVSGGFPCKDISAIRQNAKGIYGEQSGLWNHMARIIREVRPRFVWAENSPLLIGRGLNVVLSDLATLGFNAKWGIVGADDAGFAHRRKRIWILGESVVPRLEGHPGDEQKKRERETSRGSITAPGLRLAGWKSVVYSGDCNGEGDCPFCGIDYADCGCPGPTMDECQYGEFNGQFLARSRLRFIEPGLGRVANGVANRVDRLKAIGNGQVPAVARLAFEILKSS